ncbi:MAG: hypothetical protein ACXWOH_12300 [Bdellovibrionota bacterium]
MFLASAEAIASQSALDVVVLNQPYFPNSDRYCAIVFDRVDQQNQILRGYVHANTSADVPCAVEGQVVSFKCNGLTCEFIGENGPVYRFSGDGYSFDSTACVWDAYCTTYKFRIKSGVFQ